MIYIPHSLRVRARSSFLLGGIGTRYSILSSRTFSTIAFRVYQHHQHKGCNVPRSSPFSQLELRQHLQLQTRKMSTSQEHPLSATNLFTLPNFTALVTGGGTGIGLMITQALNVNGAKVYITGRRQEALDTVVREYSRKGSPHAGEIVGISCDVTKKEQLQSLAEEIGKREQEGGLHLVVCNAGVAVEAGTTKLEGEVKVDFKDPQSLAAYMLRAESEKWTETFTVNVTSQYLTSATFLPLLGRALTSSTSSPKKYSPSIVIVSSISGVTKSSSRGQFAYSASKAASLQLTQNLATTLKDAGIRVNCIAPGLFPSEMTTGGSDEKNKSKIERSIPCPAGRAGSDEDMAGAILYLVGRGGEYLNGQVLYPDGGMVLTSPARE
ncbi:hypothetical protein EV426DRAFT_629568 [Tirmania nivea]|nr:hypothetical protein EV426DRAFT_629568 [Tirmania nivea]